MVSVRARLAAFTPLVVLTLLTAAAGVAGYRTGDTAADPEPAVTAAPTPTPTPTSTPTPIPYVPVAPFSALQPVGAGGSVTAAQRSWDHAIHNLVNVASARYSWAVYFGADPEPIQRESGGFDLDPLQSRFDRSIRYSDGTEQLVHVRRFSGGTSYMQLAHWGSWTGCWLRVTDELITRQTGVEFHSSLPLPVGVLAVTDADIRKPTGFWFGAPYREYGAEVNAAEALQFLGVSGFVIQKNLTRLSRIEVPITISLDRDGRLHGGGVRGVEVAAAMTKAAPRLLKHIVEDLPYYRGAFALKGLGLPVSVPLPPPASILPAGAGRHDTCAARGPRA
jgi:hypothetical protein